MNPHAAGEIIISLILFIVLYLLQREVNRANIRLKIYNDLVDRLPRTTANTIVLIQHANWMEKGMPDGKA